MDRHLRGKCAAKLRELDLPVPFDMVVFCRSIEQRRGRPMKLFPYRMSPGLYGMWIAAPEADYIFYEQDTTARHQQHIILHEISHLLFGHHSAPVSDDEPPRAVFDLLDPELVKRAMARSTYSAVDEQEAEMLASMILQRTSEETRGRRTASPDGSSMDRLGNRLTGRPDQ